MNSLYLLSFCLLCATFSMGCDGCRKQQLSFPSIEEVAAGKSLDIDGLYYFEAITTFGEGYKRGSKWVGKDLDSIIKKSTCRIDKGRIIIVEDPIIRSGAVMVKELVKVDQFRYTGKRFIPTGEKEYYETVTNLYKTEGNGLIEEIEVPKDKAFWEKPMAGSAKYFLIELVEGKKKKNKSTKTINSATPQDTLTNLSLQKDTTTSQ